MHVYSYRKAYINLKNAPFSQFTGLIQDYECVSLLAKEVTAE